MQIEVESQKTSEETKKGSLLVHLQGALREYLENRPHMSLNSLSKKCSVSEPTLRRIMKGQIKTLPNVTTVLDILTYISGEKNTCNIPKKYPGPIAEFLREMLPHIEDLDANYDLDLNNELKHPTKYLIYKLASNDTGVTHEKVVELFGSHGLMFVQELIDKEFIKLEGGVYFASSSAFTASHEHFVENFKVVADFIKTQKADSHMLLNPLFINYSNTVNAEAYKEIVTLQKKTLKKIRGIMTDKSKIGEIPLFMLLAVDTLDMNTAFEIEKGK
ncbi:MAG: hypothetical protein HRT44_12425 [Bdellovibrionales bacterium]|nr:hypothetical protein [Bdellovibrionales bacterium]NQZ20044.1 hypothetical protein [Bdellovibrionales bacterium]